MALLVQHAVKFENTITNLKYGNVCIVSTEVVLLVGMLASARHCVIVS